MKKWTHQPAKGTNLPALVEILDPEGSVCLSVHGTDIESAEARAAEIVKILQDRLDDEAREVRYREINAQRHKERMERREKRIHPSMTPINKLPTKLQLQVLRSMLDYSRRDGPATWHHGSGWHWHHPTSTDVVMVALTRRGVLKREMRYRADGGEISPIYTALPHAQEYYDQHKHILKD